MLSIISNTSVIMRYVSLPRYLPSVLPLYTQRKAPSSLFCFNRGTLIGRGEGRYLIIRPSSFSVLLGLGQCEGTWGRDVLEVLRATPPRRGGFFIPCGLSTSDRDKRLSLGELGGSSEGGRVLPHWECCTSGMPPHISRRCE